MHAVLLLCLAVATAAAAPSKSLPGEWKKCREDDPKLGECLRDAIHVAVAHLSTHGAKEFGVFPIDPLFMSRVEIAQGSGPVAIDLHFNDLHIHGLKNTRLTDVVKADLENLVLEAPLNIAEGVTLKGHYKINGKVLVLPIKGDGECELNLENVTAIVNPRGKIVTKDGVRFGEVTSFDFRFNTTHLKIRLENLFNGNKELSTQMNRFLNENWREILNELKPAIQEAFGVAFKEITNRIFSKVPYEKLFA